MLAADSEGRNDGCDNRSDDDDDDDNDDDDADGDV